MKPDKYKEKIQEYRAASERISELYRLIYHLPPVDVSKERIFAGDWRFFVVRKDILRSSIGENVQTALDAVNVPKLGRRNDPKSYLIYNYLSRRWEEDQYLKNLSDKQFENYNFPAKIAKYFKRRSEIRNFGSKNIEIYYWECIIPRWMLEFDYKPAYYLTVRDAGYELQSELDKLNAFMARERGYEKIAQSNYDYDYHMQKRIVTDKVAKNEFQKEINEYELDR